MADAMGISHTSVQRICAEHGLKPHLVRSFKVSNDPDFADKVEDIVGLYLDPPEKALVLSVDAKSQILLLHGLFHDRELNRPAKRLPAGRFGATFDEPATPSLNEIFLPAPDRGLRNPDLALNRRNPITVRVHKDDPGAFDDLLRRVSIGEQPVQCRSSFPLKDDANLFFVSSQE